MAKARRKLTAKQIKYFGSKRQKAALRSKHRPRTRPNAAKKRGAKGKPAAKPRKVRKNPTPMIISWAAGNPANRRKKKVATSKAKKKHTATAKRPNAGRRPKMTHHPKKKHKGNPGALGTPMDWVTGGAGVVAGAVGSRALPQLVLGASNTGTMGYFANAVTALGLGWVAHLAFPRSRVLAAAVIAGGFGGLIARVAADKTPYGAALSLSGLGDWGLGLYQKSNYLAPQRVQNGRLPSPGSSMFTWGDGSQGRASTVLNAGADSTAAC